jgi:phosphohistidine phosphatase
VKRLTLMRHANAEWHGADIPDFDRPLNRRGSSEAEAMGRHLRLLELKPTLLLTSSARRAQQTSEIVARELGLAGGRIRSEGSLYLAAAQTLLSVVNATGPRIPHLMIIGHNPGISEVSNLLAPSEDLGGLGTGALHTLAFDARTWAEVCAATIQHSGTFTARPPCDVSL